MRFNMGIKLGVGWWFDSRIDSRWTMLVAGLAFHALFFPRSWYRDRPDVTGTPTSDRTDSPLITGLKADRIGE